MNWNSIISPQRTGLHMKPDDGVRTDYQRDYDRIIFSSAFRRLQDKTQIFALPGPVLVHNRLTHSLETASVGRSLGKIIGKRLLEKNLIDADQEKENFYRAELANVIAAACLAHDIGNPPFGHSGEEAISNYFRENADIVIDDGEGRSLKDFYSVEEWNDLIHFEGNANSFRILTRQFLGKPVGGFRLTYTTLAAMMKYPCSSYVAYSEFFVKRKAQFQKSIHCKKYSFFKDDCSLAVKIMKKVKMIQISKDPVFFRRHPFVFLTEAADDICYRIVDYEDAHRLNILSFQEVEDRFLELFKSLNFNKNLNNTHRMLKGISDHNEKLSFLRAKVINSLISATADLFMTYHEEMIQGTFSKGLVDFLEEPYPVLKEISKISWNKIYNHKTVVQLEIAGFKVMSDLLSLFVTAVLKEPMRNQDEKIFYLLPAQFSQQFDSNESRSVRKLTPYQKTLLVLDYFSGMTDHYIVDLYRKLFGIEIPRHR